MVPSSSLPFLATSFLVPTDRFPPPLQYSFAEQGFGPNTFAYRSNSTSPASPYPHPERPSPPVTVPISYLGYRLHLHPALISLGASFAYFARLFPLTHPPCWEQGQSDGAAVEDIDEYNLAFHTRTVPRSPGFPDNDVPICGVSPSACHE